MARARLASLSRVHPRQYWEIQDQVHDIPLEVIECQNEAMLGDARSRFIGKRVDLRSTPPFALMLVRRGGGDSLCMSLSHVVGDGMSAARLMRSIVCAYAGIEDPRSGPDPLAVRDMSFYNGGVSLGERVKELLRIVKLRQEQKPESPTTWFATPGSKQHARDTGHHRFHLLHLDRDEMAAVVAQRDIQATVTDLLIASLALAARRWNHAQGIASHRINVQTAVNLRPSEWFTDVVSNFARDANIAVSEEEQQSLASAQLAVARQTLAIKRRRAAAEIALVGPLSVVPRALRYPVAARLYKRPNLTYTTGLSNLGTVDTLPDLAHDAGRVTELWFAPPGTAALGTLAGSLTLDGEMFLALHHLDSQLTGDAAHDFAETWRNVLLGRG
jgi:NRPS condensation-like uncharacterized protein